MPIANLVALVLTCASPCPASAARLDAMIREADAVWRPNGIAIVVLPAGVAAVPDGPDVILRVELVPDQDAAPAHPGAERLGAIVFDGENVPAPFLAVHVGAVSALVAGARLAGRPLALWPAGAADAVVGRALGRVLAHEIGHFLLALRGHRPSGLMRASFDAGQLAEAPRAAFALDGEELPRLRARLAGLGGAITVAGNTP